MRTTHAMACVAMVTAASATAQAAFLTPTGAVASSTYNNDDQNPAKMINGLGLSENSAAGTHDNNGNAFTMWHSQVLGDGPNNPATADQVFAIFDLGDVYDLTGTYVWNMNQGPVTNRGVQSMNVLVSADGVNYTTAAGNVSLAQAGGTGAEAAQFRPFSASGVRFVQFDIISNFGGNVVGLSEVRFEGTGVPEPASLGLVGLGAYGVLLRRRRA